MFWEIYVSPAGRCGRRFYWLFGVLPFISILITAVFLARSLELIEPLVLPVLVLLIWPQLAVQIKRWHDIGVSGAFSVLTLIPWLGYVAAVIVGLIPGQAGDNRYGHDPAKHSAVPRGGGTSPNLV